MKELVFATVLAELKNSWGDTIADPDLINLLYDAVAEPVGLTNKNGESITVTKGTASKIMNRQAGGNPNRSIRSKSADDRVLATIEEYFKRNVVKRLLKGCEDDLIERLKMVIHDDAGIADTKKQELLVNAQKIRSPSFWQAYICTLYQGIMFCMAAVVQSLLLQQRNLKSSRYLLALLV